MSESETQQSKKTDEQLIDEIESLLEADPARFVREYVQAPGNGGGFYYNLIDILLERLGSRTAIDLFQYLQAFLPPTVFTMADLDSALSNRYGVDIAKLVTSQITEPEHVGEFLDLAYSFEQRERLRRRGINLDSRRARRGRPVKGPSPFDEQARADAIESEARTLLASRQYSSAVDLLTEATGLDPERRLRLDSEFAFLADADFASESGRMELDWLTGVWATLSAANSIDLQYDRAGTQPAPVPADGRVVVSRDDPKPVLEKKAKRGRQVETSPQSEGQTLENAVLSLLKRFFQLARDDEQALAQKLRRLRRQKSGTQFGHDLAFEFDCAATVHGTVICHVECKSYHKEIALKDIADKLIQQEFHWRDNPVDHWILISPFEGPSNELSLMLDYWKENHRYPFTVQVWSPDNGVEELFGIEPLAYEQVYGEADPLNGDPSNWTLERRRQVVSDWTSNLAPYIRLEPGWINYLKNPRALCLPGEDPKHFGELFLHHVPLRATDPRGMALAGSLEDVVRAWLTNREQPSFLVLGEFGHGKSFFTYTLCRKLAEEYLLDPEGGIVPLRLSLRDLRSYKDSHELLARR